MSFNYGIPQIINLTLEKKELLENNIPIVETAGFVPLQTRFKQLQEAGYRQRLFQEQYDGYDIEQIERNNETDILAGDDLETVLIKQKLKAEKYQQLYNQMLQETNQNLEKNEVFPKSNENEVNSQSKTEIKKEKD